MIVDISHIVSGDVIQIRESIINGLVTPGSAPHGAMVTIAASQFSGRKLHQEEIIQAFIAEKFCEMDEKKLIAFNENSMGYFINTFKN